MMVLLRTAKSLKAKQTLIWSQDKGKWVGSLWVKCSLRYLELAHVLTFFKTEELLYAPVKLLSLWLNPTVLTYECFDTRNMELQGAEQKHFLMKTETS